MTETQATAIHRTIVNSLVTCDACEELADVLELRATETGQMICSDCASDETGKDVSITTLIWAETDIEKLRRALVGPPLE